MIYEVIIIVALVGIFIILARKVPSIRSTKPLMQSINIPKNNYQREKVNKSFSKNSIDQAELLFKEGRFDLAEELFIKLAATTPEDPKIYGRLGIIYLEQKNYIDAKDAFKEAIKHGGVSGTRYYNLALAYLGLQEFRNASEAIEEAIKLDSDNDKYQKLSNEIDNKIKIYKPSKSAKKKQS